MSTVDALYDTVTSDFWSNDIRRPPLTSYTYIAIFSPTIDFDLMQLSSASEVEMVGLCYWVVARKLRLRLLTSEVNFT